LLKRPQKWDVLKSNSKGLGLRMTDDFIKMWVALKAFILTKNSHGKNELLQAMIDIEKRFILEGENESK
jgi:hypothetical protein